MLTLARDTIVTRVIYQRGNVFLSDAFSYGLNETILETENVLIKAV